MAGNSLQSVFSAMHGRCNNPERHNYHRYGGRGITVCRRWHSYILFATWAIENGYRPGLQLDRKDTDGDYTPANCQFVTAQQNANNRVSNKHLEAFGETKTLAEWLRDKRCRTARNTLYRRIADGWSPELALTKPSRQSRV